MPPRADHRQANGWVLASLIHSTGHSALCQRGDRFLMQQGRGAAEAAEDDLGNLAVRRQRLRAGADRDRGGAVGREAVDAGRDGGERDRVQTVLGRDLERAPVAAREQPVSPEPPPFQTGPTAWMTWRALSLKPGVIRASPVGQPPIAAQACASSGPAARWMAPSTPPPPAKRLFAALTIASTSSAVMSPSTTRIRATATARSCAPAMPFPPLPDGESIGSGAQTRLPAGRDSSDVRRQHLGTRATGRILDGRLRCSSCTGGSEASWTSVTSSDARVGYRIPEMRPGLSLSYSGRRTGRPHSV